MAMPWEYFAGGSTCNIDIGITTFGGTVPLFSGHGDSSLIEFDDTVAIIFTFLSQSEICN